jgi:DNA-directed RNA polymerase subunit N (RpoN/RPB10)
VGGVLLLFMVLTGRIQLITAAVAALIPLLRKLPVLLKLVPLFKKGDGSTGNEKTSTDDTSHYQQRAAANHGNMSEKEACDVLGVQQGCSREDIITAHRSLIQKLHPDRGGNNYLAAKINEAKSVLLRLYQN